MLDQALKDQLQAYLGRLSRPVVIRAVLDDRPVSREMMSLLNDIVSLSPLVSLVTTSSSGDHAPSFALETPGESISLQFAGLPLGHEFTSLVLALLQVERWLPEVPLQPQRDGASLLQVPRHLRLGSRSKWRWVVLPAEEHLEETLHCLETLTILSQWLKGFALVTKLIPNTRYHVLVLVLNLEMC